MNIWTVPYTISEQDYLDFNEHFLRNTTAGKKSFRTYRLVGVIAVLTVLPLLFIIDSDLIVKSIQLVVLLLMALLWWFISPHIMLNSIKRKLRKAESLEKSLYSQHGQLVFDFENRLIVDTGERAEVRVLFDNVTVCYETVSAFYFYFNSSQAIIMPYRIFETAEDFYAFQNLVHYNFFCSG